jgi:hypothetical protein
MYYCYPESAFLGHDRSARKGTLLVVDGCREEHPKLLQMNKAAIMTV